MGLALCKPPLPTAAACALFACHAHGGGQGGHALPGLPYSGGKGAARRHARCIRLFGLPQAYLSGGCALAAAPCRRQPRFACLYGRTRAVDPQNGLAGLCLFQPCPASCEGVWLRALPPRPRRAGAVFHGLVLGVPPLGKDADRLHTVSPLAEMRAARPMPICLAAMRPGLAGAGNGDHP